MKGLCPECGTIHGSAEACPTTQYGWVIEHGKSEASAPFYWTGLTIMKFAKDNLEAVRFARKEDAEMVAQGILKDTPTRVAEHGWS